MVTTEKTIDFPMFSLIPPYFDQIFFGQNLAWKTSVQVRNSGDTMKLFLTAIVIVTAIFYLSIHTLAPGLHS